MRTLSSGFSAGSKHCTTRQMFAFMPMRSLSSMTVLASMYMSLKDVTPEAIISIMASSLPAEMSSAVILSSTGIKTNTCFIYQFLLSLFPFILPDNRRPPG